MCEEAQKKNESQDLLSVGLQSILKQTRKTNKQTKKQNQADKIQNILFSTRYHLSGTSEHFVIS